MTVDDALLYVDELVRLANDPRYAPSPLLPQMMALADAVRALRQRYAADIEAAFREGCFALLRAVDRYGQQTQDVDEAWFTSEACRKVGT